jgi:hypothetical protein
MVAAPAAGVGTTVYELTAVIHEGRHFPVDSSFEVRGVFDAEECGTGLARAAASPAWGGALTWRRDADQVRRLQSQGAKLKLTGTTAHIILPTRKPKTNKFKNISFPSQNFTQRRKNGHRVPALLPRSLSLSALTCAHHPHHQTRNLVQ